MAGVAHDERAEEDPALALAQDRVPQRRRIAAALDAQPRSWRRIAALGHAGGHELVHGRDRPTVRVDVEEPHPHRG
jgi:hypothetical protein